MKKKQKIFFLHIPKTAGTSLKSIFNEQYKSSEILQVYSEDAKKNKDKKKSIAIITGHFYFGFFKDIYPEFKYITILRDPVERVISLYYFLKTLKTHPFYNKINYENISLKDFVLNDELFREVYNVQTKYIAGLSDYTSKENITDDTYKKAVENIENNFLIVGLTERFDETILIMKNELNWSYPFYVKQNVAKKKERPYVSEEIKKLIIERNQYDIKLYNYVKHNFQEKINNEKKKNLEELKKFTFLNSLYKYYKIPQVIIMKCCYKIIKFIRMK